MSGFDQPGVFFTDALNDVNSVSSQYDNNSDILLKFKKFIREFQDLNNDFVYRDQLKKNKSVSQHYLVLKVEDLANFDCELSDRLLQNPSEILAIFEAALSSLTRESAFQEIVHTNNTGSETVENKDQDTLDIPYQIILLSDSTPVSIRNLKSEQVSKLVKVPGVVISASSIKARPTSIAIQCRACQTTIHNIKIKTGFDSYAMPRKCPSSQRQGMLNTISVNGSKGQCPLDPFFLLPDKCKCVDSQIIKMQELHETTPPGEIPRHLTLLCNRYLVDRVSPGTRVTILGIYSIRKLAAKGGDNIDKSDVGLRKPFLNVVGIELDQFTRCVNNSVSSSSEKTNYKSNALIFSEEEETIFRDFANLPNTYDIISKSIAPSIYGSDDIKKAIACLLFGGSRKILPDGLIRRGDINVLLLGDPGTAKSQLLKFAEKVSPVGYYTSGKGSSAVGLTASLNRDPTGKGFVIEGGAMVLADGGVVCIDEFDKMHEDDRVAIHEAMEQQTISIAKAGITTTLNSRCAVLAAANSVFGRWDDTKGQDNIEFMPTIMSRFDMIFIVKDTYDKQRDMQLAKHVLQVHTNGSNANPIGSNFNEMSSKNAHLNLSKNEIDINFLSRYISYCKQNCAPRISPEASTVLKHYYSEMRNRNKQFEMKTGKKSTIYITVRQLEAIVRISESLAKMKLLPFATEEHVEEAMRLFKSSTIEAASTGSLSGAEGFTNKENIEELRLIESQIKQRFAIGTQVSEQRIVQEFVKQRFSESAVLNVINILLRRGDIQHRFQRKVLLRIK